jgi:hypothetical protein
MNHKISQITPEMLQNWNKIRNLDIGDFFFVKKPRNKSIFVFPCPHFGAYGFCISAPGSSQLRESFILD